jgi:histidinol dehydrogenase
VAKVGGAAAIAAMAIGTESVPRVAKIAGPGNRWVNAAKRQLWGRVGLDGYAGPSEVAVVADESSHVEWAAADLITQIEHAPDNVGFLVTWNEEVRQAIADAVERQIENAPRADTLRESAGQSYAILAESRAQAAEILDLIAPEHATLAVENPEEFLGRIRNAGCILLGDYSPESAGDYVAGPSHTLPTSGAARWQNPVSVLDFIKVQSIIRMSEAELRKIGPAAEALAIAEEFPAHRTGISARWKV